MKNVFTLIVLAAILFVSSCAFPSPAALPGTSDTEASAGTDEQLPCTTMHPETVAPDTAELTTAMSIETKPVQTTPPGNETTVDQRLLIFPIDFDPMIESMADGFIYTSLVNNGEIIFQNGVLIEIIIPEFGDAKKFFSVVYAAQKRNQAGEELLPFDKFCPKQELQVGMTVEEVNSWFDEIKTMGNEYKRHYFIMYWTNAYGYPPAEETILFFLRIR